MHTCITVSGNNTKYDLTQFCYASAYLINCQVIGWEAGLICYVKMIGSEKFENKQQKNPQKLS